MRFPGRLLIVGASGYLSARLLQTLRAEAVIGTYWRHPPRSTWGIEWHQDFSYLVHTNYNLLAVSVAIDDVFEENGGIRFIPQSHLKGPLRPPRRSLEATVGDPAWKIDLGEQVAGLQWVAPRIRPGGLCVHHCCLIPVVFGPRKGRRIFVSQETRRRRRER
jgi:hypothetical protein